MQKSNMRKKCSTIMAISQEVTTVIANEKMQNPRKIAFKKQIQKCAPNICAKVHHRALNPEANLASLRLTTIPNGTYT